MDKYLKLITSRGDENSETVAPATKAANVETPPATRPRAPHVGVVELVFVEPREKVTPLRPEFPPCPSCSSARYWITAGGKVVCGTCGVVRFMLAAISYHPIS
jgi:hypothetical protein